MKKALWILLFLLPISVFAKPYQVRLFGGRYGLINGKKVYEKQIEEGSTFRYQDLKIEVTDDKYYVKGIRESGEDNNTVGLAGFKIEKDMDYVVAFGIKGDQVPYHVKYLDEGGEELFPMETYYGNKGDRPVVAYRYVKGYLPNAKNITGTISDDTDFVFTYHKNKETKETSVKKAEKSGQTANDNTRQENTETGQDKEVHLNRTEIKDTSQSFDEEEPPDLIDIEDPDTPLSNDEKEGPEKKEIPFLPVFSFLLALLLVLLILWRKFFHKS